MSVLAELVMDFARGIKMVDSMAPVASNAVQVFRTSLGSGRTPKPKRSGW